MSLRAALAVALLVPGLAAAAELGRLTVLSGVGEPLRAEIEIVAVQPGEAASLAARIPPPEVFWRANLEPSPVLAALRVGVERRPNGRHVIALRSSEPIEDPFLQLLVELTSRSGRAVREYPFLLDEARGRAPRAVTAPSLPQVGTPVEDRPQPAVPPEAPEGGYIVKSGDTLAIVAQAMKLRGATFDQMLVAIYQANEQAFLDANMNRLRAGAVLAIPAEDTVRAIDPAAARRLILDHRAALESSRPRPADTPAGPADRLQLSRTPPGKAGGAVGGTAREDDVAALQRALGEAKERVALLERNVDDLRKLVVLKDRELARMQRNARSAAETLTPFPGDADAADGTERRGRSPLAYLLHEYGAWLIAALLLGVLCWIVMPFKTARLWLKRRRRQSREARRAARRVRRVAHEAGLLPSTV
jgi:pilus assembly protein FimV